MNDLEDENDPNLPSRFPQTGERATDSVVNTMRAGNMLLERVQAVCQSHGLTFSTANILAIIDGADEPLAPHVISARLVITSGAVTQLLDILEKRALIRRVRNPNDRRSVLVEITDDGRWIRETLGPQLKIFDEQWMAGLSSKEQEQLIRLTGKLQLHLEGMKDTKECRVQNIDPK